MTYFINHMMVIFHIGVFLSLSFYLTKIQLYYAYIIIAAMIVAQGIDLDHFRGNTMELFQNTLSTDELPQTQRPFHNLLIYKVGTCLIFGLWMGWTIHLYMDGLL
jgi:hypothetical protein